MSILIPNPTHFMEPESSISLSPSRSPILSHLNPVHASSSHFSKTHFYIIRSPTLSSPKLYLSLSFPHQKPSTYFSSPPYVLQVTLIPFLLILSPNNIRRGNVLTARSRVLLDKLTVPRLFKKFPAFYGTRRFISAFTSARHLYLS